MKKNCAAILFFLMALPCCKKQTNAVENKLDILTAGTWRLTAYKVYATTGDYDAYSTSPECRKDDYYRFNKDGTEEINEGPSKCNGTDPQSQILRWKFLNNNYSRIEISGVEYVVDRLEDNEFRISTPYTDPYASQKSIVYNR